MYVRKDKPYLSLTPDGIAEEIVNGRLWGIEIKDVELRKREDIEAWESNQLPNQYLYQGLHYLVVRQDLYGVIFVVRLKYYEFDEQLNKWTHTHSVEKPIYLERNQFANYVKYTELKETSFYELNVIGHTRPKLTIN